MDYEKLRNEFAGTLSEYDADEQLHILTLFDSAAIHYSIIRRTTSMIVSGGFPEIAKLFLAAKGISNKSKNTLTNYRYTLKNFFAAVQKPFDKITTNDIRIYLYNYRAEHGLQESSMDRLRSVINSFFEWCVMEGYLDRNPARKIEKIKYQSPERDYLEPVELEMVRHVCQTLREKALVDFLYSTGCRVSEVCDMLISDVRISDQSAVVRHGKGDKRRTTYINAEALISIQAYLDSREDTCPYLFVSSRKPAHKLTPASVQDEIRKIMARTNITKRISPHNFRHTTGTTAIRRGMPVEQVQLLLGHSNIATTMLYAKADKKETQELHRQLMS